MHSPIEHGEVQRHKIQRALTQVVFPQHAVSHLYVSKLSWGIGWKCNLKVKWHQMRPVLGLETTSCKKLFFLFRHTALLPPRHLSYQCPRKQVKQFCAFSARTSPPLLRMSPSMCVHTAVFQLARNVIPLHFFIKFLQSTEHFFLCLLQK